MCAVLIKASPLLCDKPCGMVLQLCGHTCSGTCGDCLKRSVPAGNVVCVIYFAPALPKPVAEHVFCMPFICLLSALYNDHRSSSLQVLPSDMKVSRTQR